MKEVVLRRGGIVVERTPAPKLQDGNVLVGVEYSLISTGTEMAGVRSASESLAKKAIDRPEDVKRVVDLVRTRGLNKALSMVRGQIGKSNPLGYSCAGTVLQIGAGIDDLKPGDRVACGGGGKATHSEIVLVPKNLSVPIPDGCSTEDASSVSLGAIAMQGVRRADAQLGDHVAVIGLGLVGQLTAQLLRLAGCHVVGIDILEERVQLGRRLGLKTGLVAGECSIEEGIRELTAGRGVDATIVTAASKSNAIIQEAMQITRERGRVVVVGDVGLAVKRQPFYHKEIDLLISRSYGPGRYDERYEEHGIDYPYAYVRWTERRNMLEYLELISDDRIDFGSLVSGIVDIEDAAEAYQALDDSDQRPLCMLLRYPRVEGSHASQAEQDRKVYVSDPTKRSRRTGAIRVAVIGAGSFATSMHLPNLKRLGALFSLRSIVSRQGRNAKTIADRFGAEYCTTDYREVLHDRDVDMVLIATRHDLHVPIAAEAAEAGKAVFLEKPMAMDKTELAQLADVLRSTGAPFTVGFNRRFSPSAVRIKDALAERGNPLVATYRVSIGPQVRSHWVYTGEGGGWIIGEACHMIDWFSFLAGCSVCEIDANSISAGDGSAADEDNFVATMKYGDGSICSLVYTSLGARQMGKERIEVFCGGLSIALDDYTHLSMYGTKKPGWTSRRTDKGHSACLEAFGKHVLGDGPLPIPLESLVETTETTFEIERALRSGQAG